MLEPLVDPDEAVERKEFLSEPRRYERGDYERGLAEADVVVEAEYRTQVALHNSMEPHGAVCRWEGETLEVYISTQFIWGVRSDVAEKLGLAEDDVRVVCNFMGGGFGSKNGPREHTYVAAELAKRTGQAVRCFNTRREENLDAGNRNGTIQRLVAGARADGTLTALGGDFVNAVGFKGFSASTSGPMEMLYACPNVRTVEYGAKLNTPPNAAFRAPGFVEGTFGLECLLDELAAKLDLDPLEVRRTQPQRFRPRGRPAVLLQEPDRVLPARRAALGAPPRSAFASRRTLEARRRPGQPDLVRRRRPALLRLGTHRRRTARVNVVTAMQDIGTGSRTAMAQIAAEELGVPLDRVRVELGDSARGPYASISAGSSTTPSMGPAVRSAAADAARQILEIAAQRYDLEQRVLSLKDGNVIAANGGSWPIEEVTGLLDDGQILGKGARGPNPTGMRVLTFGVQVAEVAVDVETGEVRVERVAAIHDVGRIVNPLGAREPGRGHVVRFSPSKTPPVFDTSTTASGGSASRQRRP